MNTSRVSSILEAFGPNFTKNSSFEEQNATIGILEYSLISKRQEFKPIIDILLLAVLVVVMLSMGSAITWNEVKYISFIF